MEIGRKGGMQAESQADKEAGIQGGNEAGWQGAGRRDRAKEYVREIERGMWEREVER